MTGHPFSPPGYSRFAVARGSAFSGEIAALTGAELRALEMTGELMGVLAEIVGNGPTREQDLAEICSHVHNLQHLVMAQAAARAYPARFRLLGESLRDAP